MRKIKLTVAYDGTNYCGWQIQPNGITIQEVLEKALFELLGKETRVAGASRTDSGVHALGNVAVFETDARMSADRFAFALNTYLPSDIKIQKSEEVPEDFHPRFTETVKTYEYKVLCRTHPDPTRRLDCLFCHDSLDVEGMRRALKMCEGEHDFRSFMGAGGEESTNTTVRVIYRAELIKGSDERICEDEEDGGGYVLRIRLTGNGFLYHMVRIIAGTLLEVGRGRILPDDMERIIAARDREAAGPTAPAHGLTLVSIRYPEWEGR